MRRNIFSTRRQTALWRLFVTAVLLLAANRIFLIGLLLPIQAVRHNEERMGTGRTAVVCRDWTREMGWNYLAYLTESGNVTMLSGTRLTPIGWTDSFGQALDCSGDAPLYAGCWRMSRANAAGFTYVFGRVDDPAIERLELELRYDGAPDRERTLRELPRSASSREDWLERDGRTYFPLRLSGGEVHWTLPELAAYDAAGREVLRLPISEMTSSYYA